MLGMTVANLITLAGVVISLVLGIVNVIRTNKLRAKSVTLEHFNTFARQPLVSALQRMDECADEIERIVRDTPTNRTDEIKRLSHKFHSARRNLDRTLNHLQESEIIPGDNWVSLLFSECDEATEALEKARVAPSDTECNSELTRFMEQMHLLSGRLHDTLDNHSKPLMR